MSDPKITKHDIMAKTQQMLQKHLYVINTFPTNGLGPVMENLAEHLEFQIRIEQEGIMFAAGPLWADNEEDWNGEGMVLIRADSLRHAREIADTDPMHSSGARTYTVRPWMINEGGFSVKVTFSDGRREIQ